VRWTLGGSRRVASDQRLASAGAGRLRASILGPTLAAGFFRREVLQALGGFDAALDERHADVALALDIAALGLLTVCEPGSRLMLAGEAANRTSATLSHGRSAERLFWWHVAARGTALSLLMHPFAPVGDIGVTGSGLGTLAAGFGRFIALLEFGSRARHEQRLAAARERLAPCADEPATIRLPVASSASSEKASRQRRAA
jgi:hypothetical protein